MRHDGERVPRHTQHHFNPRTREGCDALRILGAKADPKISIHAPVKGATFIMTIIDAGTRDFNPRTREGCDGDVAGNGAGQALDFTPRTREGCDDSYD